MKANRAKF